MGNHVETVKQSHWSRLEKYYGKRIPDFFHALQLPRGWVVEDLPEEIKGRIRANVFPIKPGGHNPVLVSKARQVIAEYRSTYCEKNNDSVHVLILPDCKSSSGWSTGPILSSDLIKEPEELVYEGLQASRDGDNDLSGMKRRAYIAITCDSNINWEA